MPAHRFTLPKPYSNWQRELMTSDVRVALFVCGSKSGKTLAGACRLLQQSYCAPKNKNSLFRIIAPTYKLSGISYRYLSRLCPDKFEAKAGQSQAEYRKLCEAWDQIKPLRTESRMTLDWRHNRSRIECLHGENPETTIEGEGTAGNVLDELSKMKEQVYQSAYSTTIQTKGWIRGYTTPRGKGWVYKLYQDCLNEMELAKLNRRKPTMLAMTASTVDNPFVPRESIEFARKTMPDRLFKQMYLAEFVDEGAIFVGFRQIVYGPEIEFLPDEIQLWIADDVSEKKVVIGADWAKKSDFTVLTAWDIESKRVIGFMRFQGVDYPLIVKHVKRFADKFGDVLDLRHDGTGIGDVIGSLLQSLPFPVNPIIFTNIAKATMVLNLSMDMLHGRFQLPNWKDMLGELDVYDGEVSLSGNMIYGAPDGFHDDIVTSLFLGWHSLRELCPDSFDVQFLDSISTDSLGGYYDSLIYDDED